MKAKVSQIAAQLLMQNWYKNNDFTDFESEKLAADSRRRSEENFDLDDLILEFDQKENCWYLSEKTNDSNCENLKPIYGFEIMW